MSLLSALRVIDLTSQIAGPYATKLLADAGADVIKVEAPDGDPLRFWTASGADLAGADGALFQFLNASKRSVVGDIADSPITRLIREADVLFEDGRVPDDALSSLLTADPALVLVSITPFGRRGPWSHRPATEFTLQADCGSTAGRGSPEREPLYAGGRLGEWIAGTYAAAAAVAASQGALGDHVDLSMLECMALTLGGFRSLRASLAGTLETSALSNAPGRTIELPSIEPTSDGLVGLCTVTGQQFQDLLGAMGRPDLQGDERFATAAQRNLHRDEFIHLLHQWTTSLTTAEVIELVELLRIPVAPIGRPDTIPKFDHFVKRSVFRTQPRSGVLEPRPPYRIEGLTAPPPAPAPRLGEHQHQGWSSESRRVGGNGPPGAPLAGVRVVDLTAFWAGPSATNFLAALGAEVIKVEGVQRPDAMRFTSAKSPTEEGWWEWSAFYQANNFNKRDLTLDLTLPRGRDLLLELVGVSDVLIENFAPRVLDAYGINWETVHATNPHAVMVRMPAFGLDGPWRNRVGFAQTMEQISGLAWVTGYTDGPPIIPGGPCDPVAGMHAAFALLCALKERDRSGIGQFVEVAMVEAALNIAAETVIELSAYGATLSRNANRGPGAAPQGIYGCRGTEQWLALAVANDEQWRRLIAILGHPEWAQAIELATAAGRHAAHDLVDQQLSSMFSLRELHELVDTLAASGVPAAAVTGPAAVLANPQLVARGFIESVDSPTVGHHELFGLPFRLATRPGPWITRPAPSLGQDNQNILRTLLGLSDAEVSNLRHDKVTGDRPGVG